MDTRSPFSPSSKPAAQLARAPQWRVVFLNDAVSRMTYVVLVLRKVFGFDETTATVHMREAHEHGRAILWVGQRERAEAYVFSLRQWHLMSIVEPNEKG
ncbi:MAG TPA: ATP-dependent Clp protease adaptor ClpS [Opitutaceae bacterium]